MVDVRTLVAMEYAVGCFGFSGGSQRSGEYAVFSKTLAKGLLGGSLEEKFVDVESEVG
jgi:hypothetical protein